MLAHPFVEHPHTQIRRAALYALAHLDMAANVETFVQRLGDPRMGVARDASNWLSRFPHLIEPHRPTLMSLRDASDGGRAEFVATVLQAADAYTERWLGNR